MLKVKISLNSIDKVKSFVNDISGFNAEFDLVSGRYVIDAKSIMGIFSLDISKPIDLNVHTDKDTEDIMAALKPYLAEQSHSSIDSKKPPGWEDFLFYSLFFCQILNHTRSKCIGRSLHKSMFFIKWLSALGTHQT